MLTHAWHCLSINCQFIAQKLRLRSVSIENWFSNWGLCVCPENWRSRPLYIMILNGDGFRLWAIVGEKFSGLCLMWALIISLCLGARESSGSCLALPTCHFELHHHHPGAPLQVKNWNKGKQGQNFEAGLLTQLEVGSLDMKSPILLISI